MSKIKKGYRLLKKRRKTASPGLSKLAKLRVRLSDIEDYNLAGINLNEKQERFARKLIKEKVNKSFVGRHPWLTGIPTLGLAPAIARARIQDHVARRITRKYPRVGAGVRSQRERDYKNTTERLRATDNSRAAAQLALGAVGAMNAYKGNEE